MTTGARKAVTWLSVGMVGLAGLGGLMAKSYADDQADQDQADYASQIKRCEEGKKTSAVLALSQRADQHAWQAAINRLKETPTPSPEAAAAADDAIRNYTVTVKFKRKAAARLEERAGRDCAGEIPEP